MHSSHVRTRRLSSFIQAWIGHNMRESNLAVSSRPNVVGTTTQVEHSQWQEMGMKKARWSSGLAWLPANPTSTPKLHVWSKNTHFDCLTRSCIALYRLQLSFRNAAIANEADATMTGTQKNRAVCTHMIMNRVYGEGLTCNECGKIPSLGQCVYYDYDLFRSSLIERRISLLLIFSV